MNKRQRKAKWQYSDLYSRGVDEAGMQQLRHMPIGCFTEMLMDDHTGTKERWQMCLATPMAQSCRNCADIYTAIRNYEVLLREKNNYRHYLTLADWVNLRDALTYMMWRYWIGVPPSFGERPAAVQKELDELIARHQKEGNS